MANIIINPAGGMVSIQIKVNSLQSVSFSITIYASDGNTVLEYYSGNSHTANPFIIKLPKPPLNYHGNYIAGTIKIFDPVGAGNNYDIKISVVQNNVDIKPVISLQGTTTTGVISHQTIFHVQ